MDKRNSKERRKKEKKRGDRNGRKGRQRAIEKGKQVGLKRWKNEDSGNKRRTNDWKDKKSGADEIV